MEDNYVFISYKSEDSEEAKWLKSVLEENHIPCWMAPASITGGCNYAQAIPVAIKDCKIFLLLISNNTQQSTWVSKEICQAITDKKIIMPFMLEDCTLYKEFAFYLSDVQRYDAYKSKSEAIKKMVTEMWSILGIHTPSTGVIIPSTGVIIPSTPSSTSKQYLTLLSWGAFTYFLCIPAGVIVTLVYLIGKPYFSNAKHFNKVIKYLCILGALIGAVIFLYAITHYSRCDEALYTSIIGLIFEFLNNM